MPYKQIIVLTIHHFETDDFWDIWEALVLKYSLAIFAAF